MPKEIERGDPLVSSGFVGYGKIVNNERGDPFALNSADRTCLLASKSGKKFFGKKVVIFEKKISFKKSRIVPKNVKGGTLWEVLTYIQLQIMKILEGGTLLEH